ncbi:SAM-dependent methyltransferase [uncultured Sphingomonas sp.]|uniref:SAM-dependent methyltransferase n=1 Tax=uncultured Sphingomonas sp. TaxID=158754 RepID=UPI00260E6D7F|nr:SAM-dependent methyltransferase [uncultured Sphingomonas sp.]
MEYVIEPIGYVRSERPDPRDDQWGDIRATIMLDVARFGPDAMLGLDAFSHVEVLFLFDRVQVSAVETGARHPRNRSDWPITGIFAQRGKNRPNRLGVTVCKIVAVEATHLHVEGLDAIDGTPVIDIKPVMREFLPRQSVQQPDWASELMSRYW